jgi:hypothetical protein
VGKVFFIATAHEQYRQHLFPPGSVVLDPWRMIPDQKDVTVKRIGENKPALISILVPSRGRPDAFARMYASALGNATYERRVEVVAWIDDDDDTWPSYLHSYPFREQDREYVEETTRLRYVRGPRCLLSEAWNNLVPHAKGEIFMHCGDDIVFSTPGWDVMVRDAFAASEDKILLVQGDDLSPNREALATHGFLHRRWVEAVGYFLPPLFSCDWNDVWLTEVADALGRRVMLPFITEHRHYSFGRRERDTTDDEREERGRADDVVGLYKRTAKDRASDVAKLRAVMA